ncbi:MAG: hypothetical protein J7502_19235 [Flavisolibacter sp.]|nr:hypothetical protein [Flavisolibacter sp.]
MEENFSPQQSLLLIQSMINKTKSNLGKNRFYFLLWGWYTFLAILAQFILKVVLHYERHYLVWLGVIPAVIITIIYTVKQNKRRGVRTYIGDSMTSLWTGVGISFFVLSFIISSSKEGWMFSYPFFILLYGLGTFISGRILKFSPLVIGGIINWILACIAAYLHYDYQMLLAAAAILISYIIPGHLLGIKRD